MAKDPAFLFYSSDFLVGTYAMTDAQVGQYVRLMCLQHQQGHLDETVVRTVMHGEIDKAVMGKFKQDSDGLYYNARLDEESAKRNAYAQSRRRNLETKNTHMDAHMGAHMERHMENVNEIVNEDVIVDGNGDVTDSESDYRSAVTIPPKVEDVRVYCQKRGNTIDHVQFCNYYETRGWMAGKVKMKNWHTAIQIWEGNNTMKSSSNGYVNWVLPDAQ